MTNEAATEEIIIKSFVFDGINDNEMRKFECWGSVEVIDRQNEIIPIDEVYKIMDIWVDRGAPINFNHTNRQVGKGLNWRPAVKNGKKGVLITGMIYKHYKEDDEIWEGIKKGEFEGLSIGGKSFLHEKDENGNTSLKHLIGYEFSVVERTGNQEATFTEVNAMAKSIETKKDDEPVMDEKPETDLAEQVSQLKNVVTGLVEKLAMVEEKIAGKPEEETPVEEQKSEDKEDEDEEDEKKEDDPKDDEVEKLSKKFSGMEQEIADLKKSIVVKTVETNRPAEAPKESKHNELRKSLAEMKSKGRIDFSEIGRQIRGE